MAILFKRTITRIWVHSMMNDYDKILDTISKRNIYTTGFQHDHQCYAGSRLYFDLNQECLFHI